MESLCEPVLIRMRKALGPGVLCRVSLLKPPGDLVVSQEGLHFPRIRRRHPLYLGLVVSSLNVPLVYFLPPVLAAGGMMQFERRELTVEFLRLS